MNSLEMFYAVNQAVDSISAFSTPDFEPYEIAGIINKMQLRFCKQRYYRLSNDKQRGFEQNQKRLADLQTLITEDTNTNTVLFPSSTGVPVTVDLPGDFMLMINVSASVTCNGQTKADVPVDIFEQEFMYHLLNHPFAQPKNFTPKGVVQDYTLKIIPGKTSILNSVKISYLRYPRSVEIYLPSTPGGDAPDNLVNCELPEHTHDEIVDMTVKHILEIISSPRYQSNSFENKQTE